MWKDYVKGTVKNNRASGVAVRVSVFIASLCLSFLCSMFYNFWLDDIRGVIEEEGEWHGRIEGEIEEEALALIQSFANVEKAFVNRELSENGTIVVDICFSNIRKVPGEMPLIAEALGMDEGAVSYNLQLLSLYFIRVPGDEKPRLLMPLYFCIVLLVCFSMILVIHNSFAVSMNARIHQFGIFSSVGASPGQIRICLLQEAAVLAVVPLTAGILLGVVFSIGTVKTMSMIALQIAGGREVSFSYHPIIFGLTVFVSVFTVFFSAWLPAGKLAALTPLEAIRNTEELQLKRKKRAGILAFLFGMEGELAGNALEAQKRALRTSGLSLTFALLGFSIMQSFFALSDLSTRETYFERYRDAWDVMVTIKDRKIEEFDKGENLRKLSGVDSVIVYQKAAAKCLISNEWKSEELKALSGLEDKAGATISVKEEGWQANAEIVVMDDASFAEYCWQIGVASESEGVIILNRVWDSINSNFREARYIPYVKEDRETIKLYGTGEEVTLPVLAYTCKMPVLREEYEDYGLVHFVPLSLWEKAGGRLGGNEKDIFIRVLAKERETPEGLNVLEEEILETIGREYETESENRIGEQQINEEMIGGYKLVMGAFCAFLAVIGIAGVFTNTLGFLRQRKREFARYQSVGLTPGGMCKMFCIEAVVMAGRPMMITLPITVLFVIFAAKASYMDIGLFLKEFPVLEIGSFYAAVAGFVALAYYLGGRAILHCRLAEALRDDTAI